MAASKIMEYRHRFGMSQERLAQRYGVSRFAVHYWEQQGKKPKLKVMLALQRDGICSCEDWDRPAPAVAVDIKRVA